MLSFWYSFWNINRTIAGLVTLAMMTSQGIHISYTAIDAKPRTWVEGVDNA